jgi:N-acetylmuramoyl-L-alanine amidase
MDSGDNDWMLRVSQSESRRIPSLLQQILQVALVLRLVLSPSLTSGLLAQAPLSTKKPEAPELFEQAVQLRTALESKPKRLRTTAEYTRAISKYRSMYYRFPGYGKADDAVLAVAELYQLMGSDFHHPGYFAEAIKAYAFLEREYPSSPYASEGLFRAGEIYLNDLRDPKAAQVVFSAFIEKYPNSKRALSARVRLHDLREQSKQARQSGSRPGRSKPGVISANPQTAAVSESESQVKLKSKPELPSREEQAENSPTGAQGNLSDETEGAAVRPREAEPDPNQGANQNALLANPENTKTGAEPDLTETAAKQDSKSASLTPAPLPLSDGTRSLTRTLGLKIGRIVIDPGHGGDNTGTIGPSGLLEKDLVLDISLELKKLIEDRLGSEVILTRTDDTFIPLEERPSIANHHQADLFISIHANSSRNRQVSGVETFFLDFATSAEAEETAARENASAQKTIFELQDLVQKIALKEKVDESREFAQIVQKSMASHLQQARRETKDRGVKQAPFIVLIGANMPSILSEVSFLSNPSDERLLKTSAFRQKVAEALCRGIEAYAEAVGGVKTARNLP